jgi:hypothetical protein
LEPGNSYETNGSRYAGLLAEGAVNPYGKDMFNNIFK